MKLKLTIDRFEEDKAILKSDNKATIEWPKAALPEKANEGTILIFDILTDEETTENKRKQAKDILNEILRVNENE
jgi:hypothetical protein